LLAVSRLLLLFGRLLPTDRDMLLLISSNVWLRIFEVLQSYWYAGLTRQHVDCSWSSRKVSLLIVNAYFISPSSSLRSHIHCIDMYTLTRKTFYTGHVEISTEQIPGSWILFFQTFFICLFSFGKVDFHMSMLFHFSKTGLLASNHSGWDKQSGCVGQQCSLGLAKTFFKGLPTSQFTSEKCNFSFKKSTTATSCTFLTEKCNYTFLREKYN
jgi:hypothetical protein